MKCKQTLKNESSRLLQVLGLQWNIHCYLQPTTDNEFNTLNSNSWETNRATTERKWNDVIKPFLIQQPNRQIIIHVH